MFDYGFVLRKNVYDSQQITIEKTNLPCPDSAKKLKDSTGCGFEVFPSDINKDMFEHILKYVVDDDSFVLPAGDIL